ncbi:hypothetical protein [Vineibacter terrae]|uniref:hypothetical protein n=1 Tax=Vineibacter terrae TaxID=2586908 RepID=UPI002E3105C7|nr:hypothetical protein [Vineibacter terrae]HEX2886797.1 hypothetical protein [Vineibacter terrae]
MSDRPIKLDADGLPANAVEIAAQAMCCGATRGCSEARRDGACLAEDLYGDWALRTISGLRAVIRRTRKQAEAKR